MPPPSEITFRSVPCRRLPSPTPALSRVDGSAELDPQTRLRPMWRDPSPHMALSPFAGHRRNTGALTKQEPAIHEQYVGRVSRRGEQYVGMVGRLKSARRAGRGRPVRARTSE
jgi:hypothetical protein